MELKMASFAGDPVLVKIYHSPVIYFIDLLFCAHLSCPPLPPLTPHTPPPPSPVMCKNNFRSSNWKKMSPRWPSFTELKGQRLKSRKRDYFSVLIYAVHLFNEILSGENLKNNVFLTSSHQSHTKPNLFLYCQ